MTMGKVLIFIMGDDSLKPVLIALECQKIWGANHPITYRHGLKFARLRCSRLGGLVQSQPAGEGEIVYS